MAEFSGIPKAVRGEQTPHTMQSVFTAVLSGVGMDVCLLLRRYS